MSLMQLLTVGHSFMDVKDVPSPYRVNRRGLLPRFVPTTVGKGPLKGPEAGVAGEKPVETQNLREHKQTLMTPETGYMASAASEATVPASSAPFFDSAPLAQSTIGAGEVDHMRPRIKLREAGFGITPGTVILRRDGVKVFKKLGLDRLGWPEWMLTGAVGVVNRRRGKGGVSGQPVRVVRNTLILSDMEIVTTASKRTAWGGWRGMPLRTWNWLAGGWWGGGSRRG